MNCLNKDVPYFTNQIDESGYADRAGRNPGLTHGADCTHLQMSQFGASKRAVGTAAHRASIVVAGNTHKFFTGP